MSKDAFFGRSMMELKQATKEKRRAGTSKSQIDEFVVFKAVALFERFYPYDRKNSDNFYEQKETFINMVAKDVLGVTATEMGWSFNPRKAQ